MIFVGETTSNLLVVSQQEKRTKGATYLSVSEEQEWASSNEDLHVLRVVIIGGGWAGFSAADALSASKDDVEIILLDASPRGPGGLAAGWRSPSPKRSVEAGIHGFWREYRNTFAVLERLGLEVNEVLTPYILYILVFGESGRVPLAPVLGEETQ
jgi:NADPH-dependent 2,4-dienoyl-CoA reductase/sulfur reductase-like enzyme